MFKFHFSSRRPGPRRKCLGAVFLLFRPASRRVPAGERWGLREWSRRAAGAASDLKRGACEAGSVRLHHGRPGAVEAARVLRAPGEPGGAGGQSAGCRYP
ncbi:hypothetical protein NN561_020377 [Cricetulus griseus]